MISLMLDGMDLNSKKPLHIRAAALKFWIVTRKLQCLGYVTGANATGTGLNSLDATISYGSDLLQVRIPYGTGFVIGVAHIVTEARAFSTNITFSGHIDFSSK